MKRLTNAEKAKFKPYKKRIAELEYQNISLLTSVENLNKSVQDLEAEVKEWKDKADLWCKTANLKDHNIMINKELEKENAELQHKVDTLQGFLDRDVEFDNLQKENVELKCECRRCVYSDSPCILSDYGKDRNGICDHFKDVFDENAELKEKLKPENCLKLLAKEGYIKFTSEQLTKAKEIIKDLLNLPFASNEEVFADVGSHLYKAEQFLNSEVEK